MFKADSLVGNAGLNQTSEYSTSLETNQLTPEPNYSCEPILPLDQERLKYVVTNFNHICRFCLSKSSSNLQMIFDDSELANYELIEMINFTLYDQVEKIDCKLSNLICENCLGKIEIFFKFKKQYEISSNLLLEAQIEIQKQVPIESESVRLTFFCFD